MWKQINQKKKFKNKTKTEIQLSHWVTNRKTKLHLDFLDASY